MVLNYLYRINNTLKLSLSTNSIEYINTSYITTYSTLITKL